MAAESLQEEIARRGSTVKLLPAAPAVERARAAGLEQASRVNVEVGLTVLFVHGTIEETAAIVAKSPGLSFAVAAHGPMMPEAPPRRVDGVPILYGGRGARFAWRALVGGDAVHPDVSLARIGTQMALQGGSLGGPLQEFREAARNELFDIGVNESGARPRDPRGAYVGSKKCA